MANAKLESLVARLEAVAGRLELTASSTGSSGAAVTSVDDPNWLDDYNAAFHNGAFASFINASQALGGELATQAGMVKKAVEAHKDILVIAARNGRPTDADLHLLTKPLSEAIVTIQEFREKSRSSKQFNHLSAISEAVPFLGWVAVAPKPANYVQQMEESAQFYTNKVLKEFRESDPKQADWSKSLIKLLKDFAAYVKDNHGTGLQWHKNNPPATGSSKAGGASVSAPPPPPAGGPPPPPPPSGPPAASEGGAGGADARSELFAQLNKGSAVTTGLKKVSDDMKTHKNPALRTTAAVPAKTSNLAPRPYSSPKVKKFTAPETKKPSVFELQEKKWVIEYQENNQSMVIDKVNEKQSVYMYKCKNSVLQVKGKINAIILDGCTKCGVVFDDLIATCEFINCQSVKAQANGKVPTISVDKTDGAQIYLNENNLETQIVSAKSSEMNVCVTKADGDLTEFPLPEQYRTVYENGRFVTTTMDLNL